MVGQQHVHVIVISLCRNILLLRALAAAVTWGSSCLLSWCSCGMLLMTIIFHTHTEREREEGLGLGLGLGLVFSKIDRWVVASWRYSKQYDKGNNN